MSQTEKDKTIAPQAERLATAWKYKGEDREYFVGDVRTILEVAYDAGYRAAKEDAVLHFLSTFMTDAELKVSTVAAESTISSGCSF